jgi:hypothetical protein
MKSLFEQLEIEISQCLNRDQSKLKDKISKLRKRLQQNKPTDKLAADINNLIKVSIN